MFNRVLFVLVIALVAARPASAPRLSISPDLQGALDRISPDSLRGNLSFLASDALEGRDSPSRGLEVAAEFIASQFRRAGLEPAGDDGFFQTAKMTLRAPSLDGFALSIAAGGETFEVAAADATLRLSTGVTLSAVPVYKLDAGDSAFLAKAAPEQFAGKVVIAEAPHGQIPNLRSALGLLRAGKPALVLLIDPTGAGSGRAVSQLAIPGAAPRSGLAAITVHGEPAMKFYRALKPGTNGAVASIHVADPVEKAVQLRNVVGVLRGSDPALRDTCVLVSAHYDHLGEEPGASGGRIYNGANDDGSGTVSVVEIAYALAALKQPPRRSVLFVTFFGEEKGLLGSKYYAGHPIFPLDKTVGDINLEQLGRTDSSEGARIGSASLTGFDYSTLTDYFKAAGDALGINVYKDAHGSDPYFAASDNLPLAEAGVPAETLCVAFQYPDYHGLGDKWNKIDYANMARVDRMVALGVARLADSAEPPRWNAANPKTRPYVKAWEAMRAARQAPPPR